MVFVPVDVVKERLQIQKSSGLSPSSTLPQYRNSWDAFRVTLSQEGLRGIYRGYGATLLSFGPFSAIYFTLYEEAKKRATQYTHTDAQQPSLIVSLVWYD